MADPHKPPPTPARENPPQKHNPSPGASPPAGAPAHPQQAPGTSGTPLRPPGATPSQPRQPSSQASGAPSRDPSGQPQPAVRPTETLPVQAKSGVGDRQQGEPVRPARHAETPGELESLNYQEHSKIPPPGSRNYVAGQPVNEEEYEETENEANRLAEAGKQQRDEAEERSAAMNPGDPNYHPVDPEHPNWDKRRSNPAGFGDPEWDKDKDENKDENKDKRR